VKFQSKLLSAFWGHPIFLGATVLLPKGYDSHPEVKYPVVYVQGHFHLYAPSIDERVPFTTEDSKEVQERERRLYQSMGLGTGFEFYQAWNSESFPRIILVSFQHPTPYFDDSYAVNSANNGPYGDALMTELIPFVEDHFRIIRKPYARVLSGGSTGGWESLALQVQHPEFFGGTWTLYPDPIDFRRYGLLNIYEDDNAFNVPSQDWLVPERYFYRTPDGQPQVTVRQLSQLEAVLGSKGRSAQQLDIWQATYGPVGEDGYPKPIWDKQTGKIDHEVAQYMKDHGYDLRHYIESNWARIGPTLVGKLHIYCGDMDDYYLNLAVYLLEDALSSGTTQPAYGGLFVYGRPMKGHGWQGMTKAELVRQMATQITKNTPLGEDPSTWKYH
jgi:enterochelin esterase-like enzyme